MREEDNMIGNSIGNYLIVDHLARGGFGNLYVGRHVLLANRMVAIKFLHGKHLASQREYERFLGEALHLEQLKHPYIVPILDAGLHDTVPYIVTAYLPNGSLEDRLARQFPNPLPIEEAMRILSQIGQALHAVHEHNIIHRDLKPANILFNARGEALLADFGIASALLNASIEQTTTFLGTVAYMAPEQFQGIISKAGDQYALACIAYQLFTGYAPFRAPELVALMYQHVYEAPVDPRCLNPHLPLHIGQALLKAMAKERTARYPDVASFLAALQTPPCQRSGLLVPTLRLSSREQDAWEDQDEITLELPRIFADRPETQRNGVQERQAPERIFDALPNGVITIDASGIITTWNTAASMLLRLNPQAMLGKHYREVFRVRPYTSLVGLLHDALLQQYQSTLVSHADGWFLAGEAVNLRFSVTSLTTDGRCRELVLVIEDRTEQKYLQAQTQKVQAIFELYVPPDVVDQFLRNPATLELGGETQEISVLFADIRGYTRLGEHLAPEQLIHVLNIYYEVIIPVICEEEGIVTGFQGDGLMAIFNAPLWQPDHALRAVRTAWKMRRAILAYQQTHQEDLSITFGIGVNTGTAMVGNLGARGLLQSYTAVGDTINVAACLQAHAPDNMILLHHSTFTRVRRAVKVALLASLEVKNKVKPLDAWLLQDMVGV